MKYQTAEITFTITEGDETREETYIIREMPTSLKTKMMDWKDNLPDDAFLTIVSRCVINSDGSPRFTMQDIDNMPFELVTSLSNEINALTSERKIEVKKS